VAGLVVLAPHLHWYFTTGGETMIYAYQRHLNVPMSGLLWALVSYVIGGIGYVSVLLIAYALMVRPDRRALRETLWPSDPDRRMLVVLLLVPLLLPLVASPLAGIKFTSLWTMPAWFLLPIILLCPPQAMVGRLDAVRLAFIVLCISLVVLAASPAVAWVRFTQEQTKPRAHSAAVSEELTRVWHETMQRPCDRDRRNGPRRCRALLQSRPSAVLELLQAGMDALDHGRGTRAPRLGRGLFGGRGERMPVVDGTRACAVRRRDPCRVRARRDVSRPAGSDDAVCLRAGAADPLKTVPAPLLSGAGSAANGAKKCRHRHRADAGIRDRSVGSYRAGGKGG
jgi:hypothetical protein